IPIYVHSEYHGGTGLAGMVASAQGVGAIIGGVSVTIIAHRRARSFMIGRLIVMLAFSLAIYALAPNAVWVAVASALLGGSGDGRAVGVADQPSNRLADRFQRCSVEHVIDAVACSTARLAIRRDNFEELGRPGHRQHRGKPEVERRLAGGGDTQRRDDGVAH